MKNIFDYVCDKEKTEAKLISGKDCMAESAQAEFEAVKRQFHKTGGRQYYHIIQSFSPRDRQTPENAHIGVCGILRRISGAGGHP